MGKILTKSIEHIFENYDWYLINDVILSKKLHVPDVDKKTAEKNS